MDGRWRLWLLGGVVSSLVGCTGGMFNRPKNPAEGAVPPRPITQPEESVSKAPLKPETLLTFANAAVEAADPKYPRSQVDRERLLNEARKNYQLVLDKQPKQSQAFAGMGKAYYYSGEKEKAVEYYQKALQLEGKNAQLWFELAAVQSKLMRDYPAATASLSEATRLEPAV